VNLLLIAIGGALGSVARYLFSSAVLRATGSLLGVGTFAVNVVGCIAFGIIAGVAERRFVFGPEARMFLLVGVLGGFTTFSSFAFESVQLLRDGQFAAASVNIVGQVAAGIIGLWFAFAISG
jgi:fluoride exporter